MSTLTEKFNMIFAIDSINTIKINLKVSLFIEHINNNLKYIEESKLCPCRKTILIIFLKEIKKYIYKVLNNYETNQNTSLDYQSKQLAHLFIDVKNVIQAQENLSKPLVAKFVLLKRTSAQYMIDSLNIIRRSKTDYDAYSIIDFLLEQATDLMDTGINDMSDIIFANSCINCEYNNDYLAARAASFRLLITDFFKNKNWINNRINEILKISSNSPAILELVPKKKMDSDIISNIENLKNNENLKIRVIGA